MSPTSLTENQGWGAVKQLLQQDSEVTGLSRIRSNTICSTLLISVKSLYVNKSADCLLYSKLFYLLILMTCVGKLFSLYEYCT